MSEVTHSASVVDAPSYEAALPLQWQPLTSLPDRLTLERIGDDNLRVLAAVSTLDEQRAAGVVGDDNGALDAEIARLHQKMNLLIDLVALFLSQQSVLPPKTIVRLSWTGLKWADADADGIGMVRLWLHPGVPQPFIWPARILRREAGSAEARFEVMAEGCQAALEKHVFVHHRRSIAGHRRPVAG